MQRALPSGGARTENAAGRRGRSKAWRSARWNELNQPFSYYFYRILPLLDVVVALGVLALVLTTSNLDEIPSITEFLSRRITLKNVGLLVVFILIWAGISIYIRLPRAMRRIPFRREVPTVALLCTLGAAPGLLFAITSVSGAFGWPELIAFWLLSILALVLLRLAIRIMGNLVGPLFAPARRCLIVGSGARAFVLAQSLAESAEIRYEVLGFVDQPGDYTQPEIFEAGILGTVDRLPEILKNEVVDELLIALPMKSCYSEIQSAISTCEQVGISCHIPTDSFSYSIGRPRFGAHDRRPVITLDVVSRDDTLLVKRAIDIVGSVIGLILLSPLMLAIAVIIRLTSPGSAVFRQARYGLNKRVFTMYKFRTMSEDAEWRQEQLESRNEMTGPVFKIQNDPRVTRIGRFLRRTSLDELPQLWNVLTGSMSLVGPRPLPLRDVSRFSDAWLMRRFSVKPGLTCLWQISGRSNVGFERWIELDLRYIDNWSLALDFRILLRTVAVVIRGSGAV